MNTSKRDKTNGAPPLAARNLDIGYRRHRNHSAVVLRQIGLELKQGEFVCLLGPNGTGKSTLLRTICGMQPKLGGEAFICGRPIETLSARERARRLSIVLTDPVNAGNLSVFALVALGRHPYTGWTGKMDRRDLQTVHETLEGLRISHLAGKNAAELSDGERQKVMIARAIAQDTDILILDEPTAYLDVPRKVEIMLLLKRLAAETGKSIIAASHDLELAIQSADSIWLIGRDGAIHAGAPEDLILNGALQSVFQSEETRFDPELGTFSLAADKRGRVRVIGNGLPGLWTRRALGRKGFAVEESAAGTGTAADGADPDEGGAFAAEATGGHAAGGAATGGIAAGEKGPDGGSIPMLTVEIRSTEQGPRWYLHSGSSTEEIPSVYHLLKQIEERARTVT
jgi:iron complex transport system ATP-binding protein